MNKLAARVQITTKLGTTRNTRVLAKFWSRPPRRGGERKRKKERDARKRKKEKGSKNEKERERKG